MGTRGLWGFVIDGETKVTYNHYDSYPGGLGTDLVKALGNWDPTSMLATVRALTMVSEDEKPTPEQQEALMQHADLGVGSGSTGDWYVDGDGATFDVYEGFQNATTDKGLWKDGKLGNGYGPVKLIASIPLDNLAEGWDTLLKQLNENDET